MRALLLTLILCLTTSVAMAADPPKLDDPPEPPPAPLRVEPEEPAPAKLSKEPTKEPVEKTESALASRPLPPPAPAERPYRIGAWIGVGLTLGFVVTGTVLGVLAQRDSDALQRLAYEREGSLPVVYDADHHAQYESLASGGASKNRATIACFIVAGVTAVTSGVLFWDASRRGVEQKKALALVPAISAERGEARLLLSGRF